MKKMYFILLPFLILSCEEEPLPKGIETNVFGQIYDTINARPIPNIKIWIAEFIRQGTFAGTRYNFKGFVDSTITDATGKYNMLFETSGKGTIYELELELQSDVSFRSIREFVNEENIGGSEEINIDALQLFPVNLKITTPETFDLPILIFTFFSGYEITQHPAFQTTSERIIWLDKNQASEILFNIERGDSTIRFQKTVPATNSENIVTLDIELSPEDFE